MKLFDHQERALSESCDKKSFAWFLETGTGKTILSIENIKFLWETGQINFALIIAPKMVCEAVWEIELQKYRREFNYRLFKWVGGISNLDKNIIDLVINELKTNKEIRPDSMNILPILIINVESFSHMKIYNLIIKVLEQTSNIVIIDESTTIKNPKAKRTKGLVKLSEFANYKRILSGYPILRSPEDLYTQILFLGRNLIPYKSFYAFRNEFCVLRAMGRYQMVIEHKNLKELSKVIQPFSIRITKKECLDLPDKLRTKRYIEMEPEQRLLYEQMKKESYLYLKKCDAHIFATTFLAQLSKLHQIANGLLLQQQMHIPTNKYSDLITVLENEIVDQCTIWFWFIDNLLEVEKLLIKQYGPNSCRTIYGDIHHSIRLNNLELFKTNKIRFLLANPSTAMHGLNLTNCSYVIYFNNSTSLEHRIQSEDRFHRIGQVNKVTYIDFITKDTVEDRILNRLQKNHKIGADVLRDEWEEWFK